MEKGSYLILLKDYFLYLVDSFAHKISIGVAKDVKARVYFYSILLILFWINLSIILNEGFNLIEMRLNPVVFWCGLIIGIPVMSGVLSLTNFRVSYNGLFTSSEKMKARLLIVLMILFYLIFLVWYLKNRVFI